MMKYGSFKILLVYANLMMDNLIPVNISQLSACLKEKGFSVKLFDTTFYRTAERSSDDVRVEYLQVKPFSYVDIGIQYKETDVFSDFKEVVSEYKPNLIALSVVEPTYDLGMRLLSSIREFGIPNIVGGVFAIFSPETVITKDVVDMVCIGEGEELIVELCEKMADGRDVSHLDNLYLKKAGRVIRNGLRRPINVESLPYLDFSIYEKERFFKPMAGGVYKMLPVEFARGCPYKCSYCANDGFDNLFKNVGKYYRKKSIKRIIREIDHYIDSYSVQYFYFVSDSFLSMGRDEFREFIDYYRGVKIPFWFNTRAETITEEKIRLLEEINCHRMSIGIEHGNEDFRRRVLNRNVTNKMMVEKIGIVKKSNIQFSVNNIIGFPDETRELIFDTIELNRQIGARDVGAYVFSPYCGTSLRNYAIQKEYVSPDYICGDPHKEVFLDMPQLSRDDIRGLARTFSLYVKMPQNFYPMILKAEKFDDEGNATFMELTSLFREKYF